jgi:hypothetical protein
VTPRRLQEVLRPEDVSLDEDPRPQDAPVHVALGGEVDHRVEGLAFGEETVHERPVLDPTAHETVVCGVSDVVGVL